MRGSSGGKPDSATGSRSEAHPGEQRGEYHAHRGPCLYPGSTPHGLDQNDRDQCRETRTQHHRQGGDRACQQKGDNDPRQHDMADGIADQCLTAQQQEIAG